MTVPPSTADRFAIIPVTHGPAPADAIITGSMSAVMENIVDSHARADALEEAAKAVVDAEEAKELAAEAERLQEMARANTVQMITNTIARVASRLDAYVARRDAEEEEAEAKRIQDELNALPDPDDPTAFDPGVHEHTGDLHTLPAKISDQPGDPAKGELEMFEPEPPEPKGSITPNPTAISLW